MHSRIWPVIGRLLKWVTLAAGSLFLLTLGLCTVAYLINAHDEPLTPQAQALLQPPPNTLRPEDNIYLALEGLAAPPGQSVIAAGQARIGRFNDSIEAASRDPSGTTLHALHLRDPRGLEFRGDISFVQPLNASVWGAAARHQREIEKLLADNRELYQRYLELLPLRGYYETARPSPYAPTDFAAPGQLHRLFLAAVSLHVRSRFAGERTRALADLELDVQLWRTVFNGEGGLISKMVAATALQGDYLLLADMIGDPEVALPLGEQDADVLVPVFDPRSWDLGSAFAAEFRVNCSILRQTAAQMSAGAGGTNGPAHRGVREWLTRLDTRIERHFFKLNATENLFARQTARRMLIARDPGRWRSAPRELHDSLWEPRTTWAAGLSYNPVGRILAAISDVTYDNYPLRVWDAAALQRLVRVSWEIRRQRVAAAEVPAFLGRQPDCRHPADGRPFLFDAASGTLRVQTVAQQPAERRFSIPAWSLAPHAAPR
jgi:hypothetical protein